MSFQDSKLSYPLTLAELKRHLNIEVLFTDDDTYLNECLEDGITVCEGYIDKNIAETDTTVKAVISTLQYLYIPYGFFDSIDTITLNTIDIKSQTTVTTKEDYFIIDLSTQLSGTIDLVFKSGFIAANIKKDIKRACLMKCGEIYDADRDNYTSKNIVKSGAVETILNKYLKKVHVCNIC